MVLMHQKNFKIIDYSSIDTRRSLIQIDGIKREIDLHERRSLLSEGKMKSDRR